MVQGRTKNPAPKKAAGGYVSSSIFKPSSSEGGDVDGEATGPFRRVSGSAYDDDDE